VQELLALYLFPEQASQSKSACAAMAHAKQADEHDKQQDKVSNKHRHKGCCIDLHVGATAVGDHVPRRADLHMDR
jgi:hypothetical protein